MSAILVPLYNKLEVTEAATGTAKESSLSFNLTNSTATVDLSVNDINGTFANSNDDNSKVKFNISTTNYTGYTLSIKGTNNNQTLVNGTNSSYTLSSISTATESFNSTDYNNTWGYLPSKLNSSTNSKYQPSPTTTATTLDVTGAANSSANTYTIGIGARASYTTPAGEYTGTYVLTVVGNAIAYKISYLNGSGTELATASTASISSTSINLTGTVPTKTGYTFKSWCLGTLNATETSCTGIEYNSNASFGIDQTSNNTDIKLYAVWTPNKYNIALTNTNATTNGSASAYATYGSSNVYAGTSSASGINTITNPSRAYTVSFGRGTNASSASISSTANKTYTYSFNGWYTATSGGTRVIDTSGALTASNGYTNSSKQWASTSSPILYAQWASGTALTLPTIALTGYTCGWSTSSTATSYTYASGYSGYVPDATRTLYGICVINTYNLVVTGDSYLSSMTIKQGSTSGTTINGTKSGNTVTFSNLTYGVSYYLYPVFTSGYEFSSYTKTDSATGAVLGSTSAVNTYYTMGAGNGAITLASKASAPGRCTDSATCMQTFTKSMCQSQASSKNVTLTDARDGNTYTVRYINGNCWMTQNLRITGTISGTYSNFNASSVNISTADLTAGDSPTQARTHTGTDSGNNVATWYNYCAASAGTICVASSTTTATQDICPSGWSLPSNAQQSTIGIKNGSTTYVSAFEVVYGGEYSGGKLSNTARGYWWGSTAYSASTRYLLYYSNNQRMLYSDYENERERGYFIRCTRAS